jgi:hypothetical protein
MNPSNKPRNMEVEVIMIRRRALWTTTTVRMLGGKSQCKVV